jgi:hypothetical protein
VAEREIVSDGIDRVELRERFRDLDGCFPARVFPFRESHISSELVDVHVERHDERARRYIPEPQIHTIRRTDHPAQEQNETFHCGRAVRIGKDVRRSAALLVFDETAFVPKSSHETTDRSAKIIFVISKIFEESVAERSVLSLKSARAKNQARDIFSAKDAMPKAA